jgi:hypothetical protein
MGKLQYPINKNYIKDKGPEFALQELVSNGLDAEIQYNAPFTHKYNASTKTLLLSNKGVTLKRETLILGGTDKEKDDRLIGQHGEGLKLALMILAREGFIVHVRNGRSERWKPMFEYSKQWKDRVLMIDVSEIDRQIESFDVEVLGVDEELWNAVKERFLKLNPPKHMDHTYRGDLIVDPAFVGKIFVNGVYSCFLERIRAGYNLSKIDTGRDRRIPLQDDIDTEMAMIWNQIVEHQVDRVHEVFDMLNDGTTSEVSGLKWYGGDKFNKALSEEFCRRYGNDTIPVITTGEHAEVTHKGGRAVILNTKLVQMLTRYCKDIVAFRKERSTDVLKTYAVDELTSEEASNFTSAIALVNRVVSSLPQAISVVDFGDTALEGTFKDGKVNISRTMLRSFGDTVGILIHEIAHHVGGDGDVSHMRMVETFWAKVVNLVYSGTWSTTSKPESEPDEIPF